MPGGATEVERNLLHLSPGLFSTGQVPGLMSPSSAVGFAAQT